MMISAWTDSVQDSVRTTVAAVSSLLLARLLSMPEAYWAAISTIIVMQSTLGAAMKVSGQRFAGTVLGAAAGGLLATYFPQNVGVFGLGVFVLGFLCAALRLENSYRFAGVTLTIIMLVPRVRPAWVVAEHRFVEVTVGIAVGLVITAAWPTRSRGKSASATRV